ncbi:pentatricopeptide repeat-containing protein At3g26630, chloroplastic-like isoform X2 [Mangifera indica]|uniref:pentatricopeptide repeat-containing protein At3g26630, chloroplastic-like isoform X2 n=1 Tax=Mangifera indica TaxID=29780 RepID=UPI001CFBCAB4|nr:pentatricopeptide repeat-containing protein At3g26630, chloroplastic-like isoform X2 [Mangifera indica]
MAMCLSFIPDLVAHKTPLSFSSRLRFNSQEALFLLRKCTTFNKLKSIHSRIIRHGLTDDQLVVRKLLDICSSYGKMDYALLVFHQIQRPHAFTWNLMIRALTRTDRSRQALDLFNLMICKGFAPDKFTFPFVIKACLAAFDVEKGKEVHGLAVKTGFSRDMFVQNTLMDLYFKCGDVDSGTKLFEKMRVRSVVSWTTMITGLAASGDLDAARAVFEQMKSRNVVSWTAMINAYVRHQQPQEAFELFWRMQLDNVRPNEFTLVSLFQACTDLGSLKLGSWIHDFALKNGFKLGVYLGTALIDMYSKCGSLEDARKVFDEMRFKNLATWNSMITSLGVHGCGEEALALFVQMEKTNIQPDAITFVGVLCACVQTNNVDEGCRYFQYMRENYDKLDENTVAALLRLNAMPEKLNENTEAALQRPNVIPEKLNENTEAVLPRLNVVPKLNGNTAAAWFTPSLDKRVADVEKNSFQFTNQSNCLGVFTCYVPQYQLQCFKWDVG